MRCPCRRWTGRYGSFRFLLTDEHDEKADRQQCAGHPDAALGKGPRQQRAETRAHGKKSDHAEVGQRFVQHLAVVRVEVDAQRLGAAAANGKIKGASCIMVDGPAPLKVQKAALRF